MLTIIVLGLPETGPNRRLADVLDHAAEDLVRKAQVRFLLGADAFLRVLSEGQVQDRLLFAVSMPPNGVSIDLMRVIAYLHDHRNALEHCTGGVIIDGRSEMFTKNLARQLIFAANCAGCAFPGRPLVEATTDLYNFHVIADVSGISTMDAYRAACADLVRRVLAHEETCRKRPNILTIHAGNRITSNTILLWETIKRGLWEKADITEISVRNGTLTDCSGCPYETCLHFGEQGNCLYGGFMVEKVYPAVLKCDTLVLLCPNYNDAVSANISAFINRLTALFRANDFSDKRLYALVVSGYSGGDIVAEQILGAMCLNKSFILPPRFCLVETANDPSSILERPRIDQRAAQMAQQILQG